MISCLFLHRSQKVGQLLEKIRKIFLVVSFTDLAVTFYGI